MVEEMDRSLSKFLYEFLPGNTMNHSNIPASGEVMGIGPLYEDGEEVELNAPDSYVIRRVKEQFYPWPNSDELLDDNLHEHVDIVVPGTAKFRTYPLAFECPGCNMFIRFSRDDERNLRDRDTDDLFTCEYCDARLNIEDQLPFVAICECGEMAQLWAPTHRHNGREYNMQLARPTTRMASWEWQCVHEGCSETLSFMATSVECPDTSCPNEDLRITNHTDSEVFYPQNEDFINLQSDLENIDNTRFRAKIISDYILEDEIQRPSEAEIKQEAADILGSAEDYLAADEEETARAREQARVRLTTDRKKHQEQVRLWLDRHPRYGERQKVSLAEECYEYLSLTEVQDYEPEDEFRSISYEQIAESPAETHLDPSTVDEYRNLRRGLNIERIHLIEDIPITTVTYGFTRINSEADEQVGLVADPENPAITSDANTTSNDDDDDGDGSTDDDDIDVQLNTFTTRKDPFPTFYAHEHRAEGVLVELSPETVLDWLEENDVISAGGRPDPEDAREWFTQSILQPERYQALVDEDRSHTHQDSGLAISRHVYTVLNSYAHAFINVIGSLAGLQRESLVERIMPHTLSFLVYKRPDTDQSFGTVLSLFEERFNQFETQFREQGSCPLNQVCFADENGSCEHCLYLPAISTENTNHNLSRSALFGGLFDSGKLESDEESITGFVTL